MCVGGEYVCGGGGECVCVRVSVCVGQCVWRTVSVCVGE